MKNIHVLPTDKPSRLYLTTYEYIFEKGYSLSTDECENKNIYITSNEEIKFNDYITDGYKVWQWKDDCSLLGRKKIILTTDQDLIKDGVQAIDDEFLEWFVKNPSCEKVEVKHKEIIQYGNMSMYDHNGDGSHYFCKNCEVETSRSKEELLKFGVEYYKIIIPKEKPKQETLTNDTDSHSWGFENFEVIKTEEDAKIFVETMENIPEPNDKLKKAFRDFNKQETLEDFAEKYIKELDVQHYISQEDFVLGAKWQAERMYSEEEVVSFIHKFIKEHQPQLPYLIGGINMWFKQFKKK